MQGRLRTVIGVVALMAVVSAPFLSAQEEPVKWTVRAASAAPVRPGGTVTLRVAAAIEDGWHIYSIAQGPGGPAPTVIALESGQPFERDGIIRAPAPVRAFDPNFEIETEYYEESTTFEVPVRVAATAKTGRQDLALRVRFQACTSTVCLPPATKILTVPIHIVGSATTPAPAGGALVGTPRSASPTPGAAAALTTPAPTPSPRPPTSDAAGSAATSAPSAAADVPVTATPASTLRSFLLLAMAMGALSLLTPCVFPMVPITVSYFTNHAAGHRRAAVTNALVYSAGIILTFTALGTALALMVGASGVNLFAANPWVNLAITAIFLGFAFSLFGAYDIAVPSKLLTRLDAATRRSGGTSVTGTLLMGLTFTLTSFTCTAPFVGTLFVMASQGDWQRPVVGMLAFSSIFALPFFALALVPQLVSQLPRAGGWLHSVKVSMGFLEVAAALKFISNVDLVWGWNVFTRDVVLAGWIAIGVLLTAYLLGVFRIGHDAAVQRLGAWRLASAMLSLALSIYLVSGLFDRRLGELEAFLPPATDGSEGGRATGTIEGELPWIVNDYDGALATAKQENKLVFVDFTGYTCTNCRWMEANMFPRPEVRRELERYVRVRLYTDAEGEVYERYQRLQATMFKTVALPFYAVLSSDARPLATFPGLTRKPQEFLAFLRRPPTPVSASR